MAHEGPSSLASPQSFKTETPTVSRSLSQTPASARPSANRRVETEDTAYTEASAYGGAAYPCPDPSRKTSPLSDQTWGQYEKRFSNVEEIFVKTWDKDLDTLLLFAALFSAVLTAFVIESYQYMKPTESTKTEVILQQILITLQSNGTIPTTLHTLEAASSSTGQISTFVRINILWFASLVTSVSTAFLAMLCKEWLTDLHEGRDHTSAELHMRGRQIQLRYDSMRDWRLSLVLPFLPFLLHVSLLLFFAGLVDFLWYFNKTVGIVAATFVAGMVLIYIYTHIRSIFSATCPYRTSLTFLILIFVNSARKRLSLDLPAALARAWVFLAVVTEEYWTYNRDAELFRAIWDVLIASWFGRRWRRLLAILGDTHILPKNLWNLWARHIALGPTNIVRLREEAYIWDHPDLMDARVLARLIGSYPDIGDTTQLVSELCNFPALVRYRALFIDAGTIDLLVHHLCHTHRHSQSNLEEAMARDREMMLQRKALARLLTEAEIDDARTVIFKIEGIPVLWDFRLRRVPKYIRFWYHPEKAITDSGLCQEDAFVEHELNDIVQFSHMLRLQLVVSSTRWHNKDVWRSVDVFFKRLLEPHTLRGLDDEELTALANATIFIGMRPFRVDRSAAARRARSEADAENGKTLKPDDEEREMQASHASNTLNVLAALMTNRPDMGLPVLRQICWGIWMLSRPIPRSLSGLLVPTITSLDKLAPALARLLSPKRERGSLLDATLSLMMCLLRSAHREQYSISSDHEDRKHLLQELLERYHHFLKRMCRVFDPKIIAKLTNLLNFDAQNSPASLEISEASGWRKEVESGDLLNTLSRVVRISGFFWELATAQTSQVGLSLASESSSDAGSQSSLITKEKRTKILSATLDVLRLVCIHLGRIKATDPQDIRVLYVLILHFTCRAVAIHFREHVKGSSLTPINEKDESNVALSLADLQHKDVPAKETSWCSGDASSSDLAAHLEEALQAAAGYVPNNVDDARLRDKIVNTLLVAVAMLQPAPAKISDIHYRDLAEIMVKHLRRGTISSVVEALRPACAVDEEGRNWAEEALKVVRDPASGLTGETTSDRRASVIIDGRTDDDGILRRMSRSVSNAVNMEKVGSDLRDFVRMPVSRNDAQPRITYAESGGGQESSHPQRHENGRGNKGVA